jgi:hypothetical protein
MEKEYSITTKVENTSENGNKTKWTVREYFIILIIKWHMMDNGRKTSFKVMVLCTMKK